MAKAKPIDSLNCNARAAEMAPVVLRARFDEMLRLRGEADGPDDVIGVHDMRVASRRFRSAVRDFAPLLDKKRVKALKKSVKELADALGTVRDGDVAMQALALTRERAPAGPVTVGIDDLIAERRILRIAAHAGLSEQLSEDSLSRLKEKFESAVESAGNGRSTVSFRASGMTIIADLLGDLSGHEAAIFEPMNSAALHKLRIAAKRLRYALELYDRCWDGELLPFAKKISKLQSRLGAIHDLDTWIEALGDLLTGSGYRLDEETAEWLIAEFLTRRTEEYKEALKIWNKWTSDVSGRLSTMLDK